MTTLATRDSALRSAVANGEWPADVMVVFRVTGDLAKVVTFRSLYRLEQRGLLTFPVAGVAVYDWSVGSSSIGRARRSSAPVRSSIRRHLIGARLSYVVRGARYELSGLPAFLMYLGVHLFYLGGIGGRRLTVLTSCIASGFGALQSQVIEGELEGVKRPLREEQPATEPTRRRTPGQARSR